MVIQVMLIMLHVLSRIKVVILFIILVLILLIVVIFFLFFIIVLFFVDPVVAVISVLRVVKVLLASHLLTRSLHVRYQVPTCHTCRHSTIPRFDSWLHVDRSSRLRPATLLVHERTTIVVLVCQLLLLEMQVRSCRCATMMHQLLVVLVMIVCADWLGREDSAAALPVRRSHMVRVHL